MNCLTVSVERIMSPLTVVAERIMSPLTVVAERIMSPLTVVAGLICSVDEHQGSLMSSDTWRLVTKDGFVLYDKNAERW